MVKAVFKYGLVAGLLFLAAILGGLFWLLWSETGTTRLLQLVFRHAPMSWSAQRIEGRLADELTLEHVRIGWDGGTAKIERIRLDWSLLRLLTGRVDIAELTITGTDILLDSPAEAQPEPGQPFSFERLRIPGWPQWLAANLDALEVDRLVIRDAEAPFWRLDACSARVRLHNGVITLSDFSLAADEGRLTGNLEADPVDFRLSGSLQFMFSEPIVDVDRLCLSVTLAPKKESSVTGGKLEVRLQKGTKPWLDAAAHLALTGETLRVEQGRLTFPDGPDQLLLNGTARMAAGLPWNTDIEVVGLNLDNLTGVPLHVYGRIKGAGNVDGYHGTADLQNRVDGWLQAALKGPFNGNWDGISFPDLTGTWLQGRVDGDLFINWAGDFALRSFAKGRDLHPEVLASPWKGRVNLDLRGELSQHGDEPLAMRFFGDLLDSTLYDQALTGGIDLRIQDDRYDFARLDLHGSGIDLTASGELTQRVDFAAKIRTPVEVVPGLKGEGEAEGWLRINDKGFNGDVKLTGRHIDYAGFAVDRLSLTARKTPSDEIWLRGEGQGGGIDGRPFDGFTLLLNGTPDDHRGALDISWPNGRGHAAVSGGWRDEVWNGRLNDLRLTDPNLGDWRLSDPAELRWKSRALVWEPVRLRSAQNETIRLAGELSPEPLAGTAELAWDKLQLGHAEPWLGDAQLSGATSGTIRVQMGAGELRALAATGTLSGRLEQDGVGLDIRDTTVAVAWTDSGLQGEISADFADMGSLTGLVHSSARPGGSLPETGTFSLRLADLPLSRIPSQWLGAAQVEGALRLNLNGGWQNREELDLQGQLDIARGRLLWTTDNGQLSASLRQAEAACRWRGDQLDGSFGLVLGDYGRLQGTMHLPIAARRPFTPAVEGALTGDFSGHLREQGLLSALFPGLVQETKGKLDFDWTLGGTWTRPDFSGNFRLGEASAYLPAAGIELQAIGLQGHLAGERIFLDEFGATSGAGRLNGKGEARWHGGWPEEFNVQLAGKNFQAVALPELQLTVDPELQLSGKLRQLRLRGKVKVSEALISGGADAATVKASPDLVLLDAETPPVAESPAFKLDVQTRIELGDHVLVKTQGIDARLAGAVEIQASDLDHVDGKGTIRVVKGAYSAYGLSLNIERGNVVFAGGPVERPALDILAVRTIGEVKAGVTVTGTPEQPVVELYSDPLMPDTDILSYMVLGRPLGADGGQSDLLLTAAGVLLSKGESVALQDRVKRRLGLDVLEVNAGNGDVNDSVVTVGKYLSPKIFISFGHALFTGTNEFRLRYSLAERWELESNVGSESGADLFYKIEFE